MRPTDWLLNEANSQATSRICAAKPTDAEPDAMVETQRPTATCIPGNSDPAKTTPAEPASHTEQAEPQPTYGPTSSLPTEQSRRSPPATRTTPRSTEALHNPTRPCRAPSQSDPTNCGAVNAALLNAPNTNPLRQCRIPQIAPCRREAKVGGPARRRARGRLGRRLAVMEPARRLTADRTGPCAAAPAGGLQPIRTPAPLTRTRVSPARSATVSSPGRPRSSPWCNVRTASSATRPNSRA